MQTDTAVKLEGTPSSSGSAAATVSSPDVHSTATDALAAGNTNKDDLGEKHGCPKQPALPQFPSKCFGSTKRSFSTYFYKAIYKGLDMCGVKNIPIVAQSYDGASVMSGHVSGVQQRIKETHPYPAYIHCLAHKLNLVLVECCSVNRCVKSFLSIIDNVYSLFSEPSNHQRFIELQKSLNVKVTEVVQPSDTRWACKWRCVKSVKSHYSLREISEEGEKWSAQASGIHDSMSKVSFITSLVVFEELLRVIHVTHKALQSSNCTLSEAAALTDSLKAHFVSKRQADSWSDEVSQTVLPGQQHCRARRKH